MKPIKTTQRLIAYTLINLIAFQPVLPAMAAGVNVATGNTAVDKAGNGVPVVNIATPNSAGISHNQYHDFNVDKSGLILNNGTAQLNPTQLGGLIQNNPNLKGKAADAIINEVVSPNRSTLAGYLEVGGKQASVMVANPYGITCDGCGFINTPQVTLTTGKPQFDAQGKLQGIDVKRGDITLTGQGLDASKSDYFSLISRTAQINAGLNANEAQVVLGANQIDANGNVTAQTADNSGIKVALDTGALGGMYTNRITLVSSDKGVGVNVGNLSARSGDITLSANGKLSVGDAVAQGNIHAHGEALALQGKQQAGGELTLDGNSGIALTDASLRAGQAVTLTSQGELSATDSRISAGVDTQGALISDHHLTIKSDNVTLNNTQLAADKVVIKAGGALRQDALSGIKADSELGIQGKDITLSGIAEAQAIQLAAETLTATRSAQLQAKNSATVSATQQGDWQGNLTAGDALTLQGGQIVQRGTLAGKTLTLNVDSLDNQGDIASLQGLSLVGNQLINSGSLSAAEQLTLKAGRVDNVGLLSARGDLQLELQTLLNNQGKILTENHLFMLADSVTNRGTLQAATLALQSISLTNQGDITASQHIDLNNQAIDNHGTINAQQMITLSGGAALNSGTLSAGVSLAASLSSGLNNSGMLLAGKTLAVTAGDVINDGTLTAPELQIHSDSLDNQGIIQADHSLTVSADRQLVQRATGKLLAGNTLTLTAAEAETDGELQAEQFLLNADRWLNRGKTSIGGDAQATAYYLDNSGSLLAQGRWLLSGHDLVNQGILQGERLELRANSITNSGQAQSLQSSVLNADDSLINTGSWLSGDALRLNAQAIDNSGNLRALTTQARGDRFSNRGQISGIQHLDLNIFDRLDNQGTLDGNLLAITAGSLNNSGQITGADDFQLSLSGGLDNRGLIHGNSGLNVAAGTVKQHGTLEGQSVRLDAAGLDNQGTLLGVDALILAITNTLNNQGELLSQGETTATAGQIDNRGLWQAQTITLNADTIANAGKILGIAALILTAKDTLINQQAGKLLSQGMAVLTAADATNAGDWQAASLTLGTGNLTNSGQIQAEQALTLRGDSLSNAGRWESDILQLFGKTVINQGTLLGNHVGITADSLINDGMITGVDELTLMLDQHLFNHGNLYGDRLWIDAAGVNNRGGLFGVSDLQLNLRGDLDNAGTLSGKTLALTAENVWQNGILEGQTVRLNAGDLDNQGKLLGVDALTLAIRHSLQNSGALLSQGDNAVTAQTIDNRGQWQANTITLTADEIANAGQIAGLAALQLTASHSLQNLQSGKLLTQGVATLQAADTLNDGEWQAGNLLLETHRFTNEGWVQGNRSLKIAVTSPAINQSSLLTMALALADDAQQLSASVPAGTLLNNGTLISGGDSQISAGQLDNWGTLSGNGYSTISSAAIRNDGNVIATDGLSLNGEYQGSGLLYTAGVLALYGDRLGNTGRWESRVLQLTGQSFDNQGTIIGERGLELDLADELTVGAAGQLLTDGELLANVGSVSNQGFWQGKLLSLTANAFLNDGTLVGQNSLQLALQNSYQGNDRSQLLSDGDATLTANRVIQSGEIAANNLQLNTATLDNAGRVLGLNHLQITNQGEITNRKDGEILTNGDGVINSTRLSNSGSVQANELRLGVERVENQGRIQGTSALWLLDLTDYTGDKTSQLLSSGAATIQSKRADNLGLWQADNLTVQIGSLVNGGTLAGLNSLSFMGEQISNQGDIFSQGALALRGATFDNAGTVTGIGGFDLQFTDSLLNQSPGRLLNGGVGSINTDRLINRGLWQSDNLYLVARELDNQGQMLGVTQAALQLSGDYQGSSGSQLVSGGYATLTAANINNRGQIQAQSLDVTADSLTNQGMLSGNQNLNATVKHQLDNAQDARLVSDGALSVQANHIDNQGTVKAASLTLHGDNSLNNNGVLQGAASLRLESAGQLTNQQAGQILSDGTATLKAAALDNAGWLQGRDLDVQTQQFTQQGSLIAQDKMTLRIPQWVNQGLIQAQQAEIIADVLENQGTLLGLTQLALQTHRLINQQDGKIYSAQDLILKTDELQQDGQLLALGNLTADISGPLAFSRLLAAGNRLTLNVAGDLDLSGTLQGQSVALASAGKLTNQGNILAGDGDSRITAQDIVQQEAGSIQAGGNLSLVSANDIHNQGLIGVAGDLLMQAGGLLNNTSLLYAAGNMRLFSDSLSNVFGNILAGNNLWLQRDAQGNASSAVLNSSGTIETQSGDITITTGTLTNQREGLVVTETQLDVGQMPSWAGGTTANIPIDWFKAGEVGMFRKETTVKGGGNNGSSESIRYDFIYAPYEKADIQRIIAGSKFVDVHVQGDAARISAGNDLFVNAGELNNQASQIFSVENILLKGSKINNQSYISGDVNEILIYEYKGQSVRVFGKEYYGLYRPSKYLYTDNIYIQNKYIPYVLSGSPTYEQTTGESYNALIQAGGTITADFAEDISNTTLQPGSGGFMPGTVTPVLASTQALSPLQKQTTRQLVDNDASLNADTVDLSNTGVDAAALGSNASAVSPAAKNVTLSKVTEPTLQSGVQAEQITAGTAVTLEKPGAIADGASTPVSVEASATSHLSASELMSAIGNGLQALSSNPLADYPLPAGNNGLLVVDPSSDSRYLIHTNPKLEQLGQVDNSLFNELQSMLGQQPATTVKVETSSQWTQTDKVLGSSYLLDKLNLDADHDYRFLGDAEFDTRYISNAVLSQSGKRYLDGTGSDLSQMQMLLDNAATAQKGLNLQLGVSLTPDQVANLSQSIVWWENIEVNGQTVLAPKLYLAQADKNNVQGSAIVANQVSLSAGGNVTNSGTISAVELLAIASGDKIDNQEGGLLKSDGSLNLVALNNITNSGSQIEGNTLQLASINGDIINKTESREWQTSASAASGSGMGYLTFTELGKTAEITAANSLTMTAGHDIRNVAATLSAGQDMTLNAANNVSIEALTLTNDRLDQGRNRSQLSLNTAVQGSQLTADGTLQANAGNNIQIDAGMISGGAGLSLTAANDIQLTAQQTLQETLNHNGGNTAQRRTQEIASTQLLSGGDLELLAGRDVLAEAASLNAKGDATLAAGRDLNLLSAEEESYSGNWWKRHADWQQNITQQSTELTAGAGLNLQAGRDINLQAAQGIAGGALTTQAGNDINLLSATETQHTFFEETKVKKKTFSKTVTHTLNETLQTDEKGSLLSGDSVTMAASHDINLQGSSVVGDNQVVLLADNDVNTAASVENYQHYEEYTKKKSGLFSSGGIGFTIGSTSTSQKLQDQAVTQSQSVSTLGSTGQSVTINAGNDVNISGTDMVAGQDITLTGNNVTIDPGYDLRTQQQQFEQKSSGLTVALSGVVGSALNSAVQSIQAAQSESDGRLALLQGMKAGLSGFQAYQASQSDLNDQGSASFVGVSISLGAQTSRSSQTTEQQQSFGSTLNAGHDIAIESRQGDITVTGSQLKAANDVVMNAAQDINLLSSRNSETLSGKNSSSGGNIGVSLGISNGSAGLSIFANVNGSKGRETGAGNSWSETTVDAGSEVKLESQRDTRLIGAQVTGEHIDVQTGRDLLLQSQQDSDRYDSKQVSGSAGGSFTWGSMSGSGYFSVSQDKMHSNYDSVQQQTGFFAGKEGFDIKTGNHTQLDAAVIASTASADKNTLDTGTLGWSGVDNKAEFKVEHSGFGMSASPSMNGNLLSTLAMNVPSALMSLGNNGNASSTTYAAVSDGSLLIRDNANQQQDITTLSRDVEHANNALSPIFNKEKEQKRLKQAQLIGELGAQVMDIVRTEGELRAQKAAEASGESKVSRPDDNAPADEWDAYKKALTETASYKTAMEEYGTGGTYQRAAQAATAAIQALAGGDIQKAIASGASPYLAQMVKDITMPQGESGATASDIAANAMAHAVVGAVVAQLSGQDAAAGAIGAAGGELLARVIMETQYPGKKVEDLTEEEKQSVSALSTLAAGLASGLATGDTASAASGAQAGRNAVENNFLGATSSDKLDKAVEKIKNGDKTLATANELIKLENADKRSDALVDKFTRDPSKMGESEQAELAGYLRVYASEMEKEYGSAVSQELVKGLLSGQDYIKRNPDSEAMSKAQAIMNTWGYHKSNASIGDAPLIFGSSVLGTTIKEGMALNAAIGVGVNTVSQLSGKEPFSYVDAIMAGITSAATTGKGIGSSAAINMAGAAVGSGIKGEDPTNSVIGAGLGSVAGSKAEKYITGGLSTAVKEGTAEVVGAVGGSTASEIVSDAAKNALDKAEHKDEKK